MDKIKTKSLKTSMAVTFLVTICVITLLSAIAIFTASQLQQEIVKKRYLTIKSPDYQVDENTGNYVLDIDNNNVTWHPLSAGDTIAYYGSYAAMIGLPVFLLLLVLEQLRRYITERNSGRLLHSCRME